MRIRTNPDPHREHDRHRNQIEIDRADLAKILYHKLDFNNDGTLQLNEFLQICSDKLPLDLKQKMLPILFDQLDARRAPGLKWKDVGLARPTSGEEIFNQALEDALHSRGNSTARGTEFAQWELEEFGQPNILPDSFISVLVPTKEDPSVGERRYFLTRGRLGADPHGPTDLSLDREGFVRWLTGADTETVSDVQYLEIIDHMQHKADQDHLDEQIASYVEEEETTFIERGSLGKLRKSQRRGLNAADRSSVLRQSSAQRRAAQRSGLAHCSFADPDAIEASAAEPSVVGASGGGDGGGGAGGGASGGALAQQLSDAVREQLDERERKHDEALEQIAQMRADVAAQTERYMSAMLTLTANVATLQERLSSLAERVPVSRHKARVPDGAARLRQALPTTNGSSGHATIADEDRMQDGEREAPKQGPGRSAAGNGLEA